MQDRVGTTTYSDSQTHTHACTHVYKINMSSILRKLGIYSKDQTNLRTHGVEGGPEINSKGSVKLFNEIIAQNILNLKIETDIQIQEAYRTPNSHDQRLFYDTS